jgi:hypothetical protein
MSEMARLGEMGGAGIANVCKQGIGEATRKPTRIST